MACSFVARLHALETSVIFTMRRAPLKVRQLLLSFEVSIKCSSCNCLRIRLSPQLMLVYVSSEDNSASYVRILDIDSLFRVGVGEAEGGRERRGRKKERNRSIWQPLF